MATDQPTSEATEGEAPDGARWTEALLILYLAVLGLATIGELFEIDWILDLFS